MTLSVRLTTVADFVPVDLGGVVPPVPVVGGDLQAAGRQPRGDLRALRRGQHRWRRIEQPGGQTPAVNNVTSATKVPGFQRARCLERSLDVTRLSAGGGALPVIMSIIGPREPHDYRN